MNLDEYPDHFLSSLIDGADGRQGFGPISEWETDHWEHLKFFILIYSLKAEKQFSSVIDHSKKRPMINTGRFQILDKKLEDSTELNNGEKYYLRSVLRRQFMDDMEQAKKEFEELFQFINDRKNQKSVGRPIQSKLIYQWMDYLTNKLGSINKAVAYIASHPVVRYKSYETLKREYRKYRREKEGEGN